MNTKYRLDRLQFLTPPTFQPSLAFFSQITVAVPFFLAPFSLASALDALLGTSCLTLAGFFIPGNLSDGAEGPMSASLLVFLAFEAGAGFSGEVSRQSPGHHHPGACHVLFPDPAFAPAHDCWVASGGLNGLVSPSVSRKLRAPLPQIEHAPSPQTSVVQGLPRSRWHVEARGVG